MHLARPVSKLPAELIAMVMDHVDLAQLVQLSRLCVRWRVVAQSHPHYWRTVRLAAVSAPALDFFRVRLDRAAGRSISVDICLEDSEDFGPIRSVVLPAVARCLAHISRLGLFLHYGVSDDVISTLLHPAPHLKAIAIQFLHSTDGQPAVLLSGDLLAGGGPKLSTVVLHGVSLPSTRITAFSLVHYLRITSDYPEAFQIDLLYHFPALKSLSIISVECTGLTLGDRSSDIASLLSLNRLDFHLSYTAYDEIFSWIPRLETISNITCQRPPDNISQMLIGHLPGELKLAFLAPYATFVDITVSAPTAARARTFVQAESRVLEDWPRDVILAPAVVERITTLRLLARLAPVIPHLGTMRACKQLELVVLAEPPFVPPGKPPFDADTVRFPALESVVITLGDKRLDSRTVPAEALHAFLTEILGPRTKRAALRLERVLLSGDKRELARDFNGV